jgi:hypothetical protein
MGAPPPVVLKHLNWPDSFPSTPTSKKEQKNSKYIGTNYYVISRVPRNPRVPPAARKFNTPVWWNNTILEHNDNNDKIY